MRADDDEALSWDEVSDPTHAAGPAPATPAVEPAGEAATAAPARAATSSALLVTYGILAGAYLLYTVGWVLGIRATSFVEGDTLLSILSTMAQVLALASPAVWYAGSFVLTRRAKPITRLLLLLLGLAATLPLPFVLPGVAA